MIDVLVVGGGHAGVEAAAAAARMGVSVCMVTYNKENIGQMSCNPAIGGLGKGQLVKEVDALGGIMGRAIDRSGIQFRMLNASKGPAVRSSRAQADRDLYRVSVQQLLAQYPNLEIIDSKVESLLSQAGRVAGVILADGTRVKSRSVVLTTGTFLRGLMHTGEKQSAGGRCGDFASNSLSECLRSLGLRLGRLKTGTPPRLLRSSIDYSKLEEQPGDLDPQPFSMFTTNFNVKQLSCWLTTTNQKVHEIIQTNKDRSPMFNGQIKSGGPRYCPSIEDKVFRFAEKTSHQVFLEPEGYTSDLVYPNGISTSLPYDVQCEIVRNIKGLEHAKIVQPGYAVEYDFADPCDLTPWLESKILSGLFLAGQINGTSGYEEAAGQGIVAGASAAAQVLGKPPLVLSRGDAYIGVMVDDLVTCGVDEPYRMFTSRAEYRLTLREDNAWIRLGAIAQDYRLLSSYQKEIYQERLSRRELTLSWLASTVVKAIPENNDWLIDLGSSNLKSSITLSELLRRPEITIGHVRDRYQELLSQELVDITTRDWSECEIEVKFAGYLQRQREEIERLKKSESLSIPVDFPYDKVGSLRTEALEKFRKHRPCSVGQALRIPGITPSAVSQVAVYLKKFRVA